MIIPLLRMLAAVVALLAISLSPSLCRGADPIADEPWTVTAAEFRDLRAEVAALSSRVVDLEKRLADVDSVSHLKLSTSSTRIACPCNTFFTSVVTIENQDPAGTVELLVGSSPERGTINGVNINQLNATALRNTGNQTVEGSLQVDKLVIGSWALEVDAGGNLKISSSQVDSEVEIAGVVTVNGDALVNGNGYVAGTVQAATMKGNDGFFANAVQAPSGFFSDVKADQVWTDTTTTSVVNLTNSFSICQNGSCIHQLAGTNTTVVHGPVVNNKQPTSVLCPPNTFVSSGFCCVSLNNQYWRCSPPQGNGTSPTGVITNSMVSCNEVPEISNSGYVAAAICTQVLGMN